MAHPIVSFTVVEVSCAISIEYPVWYFILPGSFNITACCTYRWPSRTLEKTILLKWGLMSLSIWTWGQRSKQNGKVKESSTLSPLHPLPLIPLCLFVLDLTPLATSISGLRKHDVAFLITLRPPNPIGTYFYHNQPFVPQAGLTYIRGCEIEGMLDENGRVIEEGESFCPLKSFEFLFPLDLSVISFRLCNSAGPDPKPEFRGDSRTYRVWLDPNQYQSDMTATIKGHEVRQSWKSPPVEFQFIHFFSCLFIHRMSMIHSMSSWEGSLKRTTSKLSWRQFEIWWTQSAWSLIGCMTSF